MDISPTKILSQSKDLYNMKCPIDQTEMEKGTLWAHGSSWKPGALSKIMFWGMGWFRKNYSIVIAFKCPKCGKIELTTEPDNKENK